MKSQHTAGFFNEEFGVKEKGQQMMLTFGLQNSDWIIFLKLFRCKSFRQR